MVGGSGIESLIPAMSTISRKYKRLTRTDFQQLAQKYISDRINTRGLTNSSLVTISGHFNQILRGFPDSFTTESELIIWLGQKRPGIRRRLFETLRAFGRWMERKRIMPDPWDGIEVAKVPVPLLPSPEPEQVYQLFEYLDDYFPQDSALRNEVIIAIFMESSLRLSELASIKLKNIDWKERTINQGLGQRSEGKESSIWGSSRRATQRLASDVSTSEWKHLGY